MRGASSGGSPISSQMVRAGTGSLKAATMSTRARARSGGELLVDDARDRRLERGDGGGAEVGLEQLAVPGVQRRVGGGQHVDRVAERSHAERDRAALAVVVEEADEVGREVLGRPTASRISLGSDTRYES